MSDAISIITAVHNALAMNRLYWKCLQENTTCPFELIIVDNHSTDGSEEFFRTLSERYVDGPQKVVYLRNEKNYSYPTSQNQGMRAASHPTLCFLNNDIWMPKHWQKPFIEMLKQDTLLVLSPAGHEAQPFQNDSDRLKAKWRRITTMSRIWKAVFRKTEEERLWKSLAFMYGSLENFTPVVPKDAPPWMVGIKGDVVVFHKDLLDRFPGVWDERTQAADWHLYLTIAAAHEKDPSIPLPRILFNAYVHHFGRYSARLIYEPMTLSQPLQPLEALWPMETIRRLWWGYYLPKNRADWIRQNRSWSTLGGLRASNPA